METLSRPEFRSPLYIAWEVTRLCNARCLQCYSSSGPGVRDPNELTTEQALRIIDDLAESGLVVLAFSGGEPLLRRDIFQLIERATRGGLVVHIATNGFIINESLARRIKDSGVRGVTVSVDGADAATHDHMRQRRGLFERTIKAIQTLVSHDVRVVVSFTPTRINHHHGPAVVRLSHELGAEAVNMSEYVPAGRGTLDLALPPDQLRGVVQQWIDMRREYLGRIRIIWHDCRVALLVPPEERDLYSGCGAGRLTARLCVDGTLTPCVFLPNVAGDLRVTPFREVWERSALLRAIRDRSALHDGNCARCDWKSICGGCRAVSMATYGDVMRGDPSCWIVREDAPLISPSALVRRERMVLS
jgi:AdoMet-dependent heme synthase